MMDFIVFPGKSLAEAAHALAPREKGLVLWTMMENTLPSWLPQTYATAYGQQILISMGREAGLHKYHDSLFSASTGNTTPWWAGNPWMVANHRGFLYRRDPRIYSEKFPDIRHPGDLPQLIPGPQPRTWFVKGQLLQEDPELFQMLNLMPPINTVLQGLRSLD